MSDFIGSVGTNDIAGAATTITQSVTCEGGELLLCIARCGDVTSVITVSDDSGSNVWIPMTAAVTDGAFNIERTYYCLPAAAGTYTVTAAFGGSFGFRAIACPRYRGLGPLNTSSTGSVVDGSPTYQVISSSFTTTAKTRVIAIASVTNTTSTFIDGSVGSAIAINRTSNSDQIALSDAVLLSPQAGLTARSIGNQSTSWMQSVGAFVELEPHNFTASTFNIPQMDIQRRMA